MCYKCFFFFVAEQGKKMSVTWLVQKPETYYIIVCRMLGKGNIYNVNQKLPWVRLYMCVACGRFDIISLLFSDIDLCTCTFNLRLIHIISIFFLILRLGEAYCDEYWERERERERERDMYSLPFFGVTRVKHW